MNPHLPNSKTTLLNSFKLLTIVNLKFFSILELYTDILFSAGSRDDYFRLFSNNLLY